jgi:hypothetical protein
MKLRSDKAHTKPRTTDVGWLGKLLLLVFVGLSIYLAILLKHSVGTGAGLFSHENIRGSMWFAIILLSAWVVGFLVVIRRP